MVNRRELCLILLVVLMLLAWYIYYICSEQGRYLRHLIIVTDKITLLIVKIKNLIENICFELKRNMAEYLNVVYKLALFALAKSITGDPDIWKVYWMASFATFAISCYCLKLCVERKRAQITPTSQSVTPTNSEKVWFLTATKALEFLFPLSYLRLAFAYFMELNPINHHTENYWKTLSHATKIGIDVLAVLIPVISIFEISNTAQQVEDQPVADPPKVVQGDANNQLPEVVQKDVKNQSYAYAKRPEVALQMDSGNQSVEDADPPGVPIHIDDVENQSFADANRPEVALQMDAEDHSAAYVIVGTNLEYLVPAVSIYGAQ